MIKQFAQGYVAPGEKLGTAATFSIGGLAGIITVYVQLQDIKRRSRRLTMKDMLLNLWMSSKRGNCYTPLRVCFH